MAKQVLAEVLLKKFKEDIPKMSLEVAEKMAALVEKLKNMKELPQSSFFVLVV